MFALRFRFLYGEALRYLEHEVTKITIHNRGVSRSTLLVKYYYNHQIKKDFTCLGCKMHLDLWSIYGRILLNWM
jgi:hypothetical protein